MASLRRKREPKQLFRDPFGVMLARNRMKTSLIRENIEAAGGRPFVLRMSDGSTIPVPHTDQIIISTTGRQLAFFTTTGSLKLLDTAHITSIEFPLTKKKAA
jgi:hypothetical protein